MKISVTDTILIGNQRYHTYDTICCVSLIDGKEHNGFLRKIHNMYSFDRQNKKIPYITLCNIDYTFISLSVKTINPLRMVLLEKFFDIEKYYNFGL